MTTTVVGDLLTLAPDSLNDFDVLVAGGRRFLGFIAKGDGGGHLVIREFPQPGVDYTQRLGDLGLTAPLEARLFADGGTIRALVVRDTDDTSGERTYTEVDTGIALAAAPAPGPTPAPVPVPTPAPTPAAGGDLAPVLAAERSTHDGVDADYRLDQGQVAALAALHTKVDGLAARLADLLARPADGAFWVAGPAPDNYNVPPQIAPMIARESQQSIYWACYWAMKSALEDALLDQTFPDPANRRFTIAPA